MFLFIDKNTGKLLINGCGWREPSDYSSELDTILKNNLGYTEEDLLAYEVNNYNDAMSILSNIDNLDITIVDDTVVSIVPKDKLFLYLHIVLSGGDGDDTPGILNDGVDSLTINAVLRATEDPTSAKIQINGSWRITIRDDTNAIYDVVKVSMINGEVNILYTTTGKPTICKLDESDLSSIPNPVGGSPYIIKLVGQTKWKVYRTL